MFSLAVAAAAAVFVLFISFLSFFKGDPAWGHSISATPIFAVLWIFAPAGSGRLRQRPVVALLVLGLVVQLGALSIDPLRLRIERASTSMPYVPIVEIYFHPSYSQLVNRPREIIEVLSTSGETARYKSPGPVTDLGITVAPLAEMGPAAIRKSHDLNSFRPWWVSLSYLDDHLYNVNTRLALTILGLIASTGLILLVFGVHEAERRDSPA